MYRRGIDEAFDEFSMILAMARLEGIRSGCSAWVCAASFSSRGDELCFLRCIC